MVNTNFMPMDPAPHGKDLTKAVEEYYGTGLYLAVERDESQVLLAAPSIRELYAEAKERRLANYVIVKAPKGPYRGKIL